MNKVLAVLLTVFCTVGSAQMPDDWFVVSLDVVKTEKLEVPKEVISTHGVVTLRHLGNIYKAGCTISHVLHLQQLGPSRRDDRMLKGDTQPCGQLMAPYVGKSIANWTDDSVPKLTADGWRVGVGLLRTKTPSGKPEFLLLQKGPQPGRHDEAYSEYYLILSVNPAK
jgi:hypothetical protein